MAATMAAAFKAGIRAERECAAESVLDSKANGGAVITDHINTLIRARELDWANADQRRTTEARNAMLF